MNPESIAAITKSVILQSIRRSLKSLSLHFNAKANLGASCTQQVHAGTECGVCGQVQAR